MLVGAIPPNEAKFGTEEVDKAADTEHAKPQPRSMPQRFDTYEDLVVTENTCCRGELFGMARKLRRARAESAA